VIEVSLEDALLRAREYQGIEDASPLVTAALHRFLLAVLHRALAGPRDPEQAADWFRNGFPAAAVRDYLARYRSRCDLFDPVAPFYQTPDFTLEESARSWTVLAAELNRDNNKVLFDHTTTIQPEPLRLGAAARLLIANQSFALQGGRSYTGYTSGAPLATAATVLVQEADLHKTLCLNLPLYIQYERDQASWEKTPLAIAALKNGDAPPRAPVGRVDRYTWPTRAIRLHPEERDGTMVVTRISYAAGVRCDDPSAIPDPLVAYRRDQKDPARRFPRGFSEGRALWRDFHALLPAPNNQDGAAVLDYAGRLYEELALDDGEMPQVVQVLVLGQVNDQALIKFWRAERYQLPARLLGNPDLHDLIQTCLHRADETWQQLNGAARALARRLLTRGDRQPHKDDVRHLAESFPHGTAYWSVLEEAFGAWLAGLGPDAVSRTREQERAWLAVVDRQARRAWELTARAAGDDAQALRAIFASEGLLFAYLAKQRKEAA
jgi:CRISPR system Cascade subunit CasA